jgi:hypothetical protein
MRKARAAELLRHRRGQETLRLEIVVVGADEGVSGIDGRGAFVEGAAASQSDCAPALASGAVIVSMA